MSPFYRYTNLLSAVSLFYQCHNAAVSFSFFTTRRPQTTTTIFLLPTQQRTHLFSLQRNSSSSSSAVDSAWQRNDTVKGHPSDVIVHVGNLDWTISPQKLSDALLHATGTTNRDVVVVTINEIPNPARKRDEGKLHGGSATLRFASNEEAVTGMENLKSAAAAAVRGAGNERKRWRVRWAWISLESIADEDKMDVLTPPERVELRRRRAESYARRRRRIAERTDEVIRSVELALQHHGDDEENTTLDLSPLPVLEAPRLDWSNCPDGIDPIRGGGLREGTSRGDRKRAAVEAFLHVVRVVLSDNTACETATKVADLGSGAGNLSLPLAWWLQQEGGRGVVAVDINGHALDLLEERANATPGVCIETIEQDLLRLIVPPRSNAPTSFIDHVRLPLECSAVVSLHACGSASDLAMAVAISHSLPFAISPCCIGKLNASRSVVFSERCIMPGLSTVERSAAPQEIAYPRSNFLSFLTLSDYRLLAAAADYGVDNNPKSDAQELARRLRCKKAKQIVETDRLHWAKERGYEVCMLELPRIGPLYPKRELLLGAKKGSKEASRILNLVTTKCL